MGILWTRSNNSAELNWQVSRINVTRINIYPEINKNIYRLIYFVELNAHCLWESVCIFRCRIFPLSLTIFIKVSVLKAQRMTSQSLFALVCNCTFNFIVIKGGRHQTINFSFIAGVGNSSESVYIRTFVHYAQCHGYRIAVLNHIGVIDSIKVTSHRIFSYGECALVINSEF